MLIYLNKTIFETYLNLNYIHLEMFNHFKMQFI